MNGLRGDLSAIVALASQAAGEWRATERPEPIQHRENTVFRMVLADGRQAALRVHRPGYHERAALVSELAWTEMLRAGGIAVPAPIALPGGEHVLTRELGGAPVHIDAVEWMAGVPLGRTGAALELSPRELERVFGDLGASMARMHNLSDGWTPPGGFSRPAWDTQGLVGEAPLWGRFWDLEELSAGQRRLLIGARDAARAELAALSARGLDYGLIHADLVRENVLVTESGVGLIDFDDCGYGWRMFDIATVLLRNRSEPAYPRLVEALTTGYRTERRWAEDDLATLPLFLALRSFTYLGWLRARRGEPGIGSARIAQSIQEAVSHASALMESVGRFDASIGLGQGS